MNHIIKSQKPLKGNKKTATCAVYFPPVRQTFCRTGFSWCYSVVVVLPLRLQALQTLLLELFQLTKALRVIFNLDSSLHSTKGITNNLMADIVTRVLSDHPEVSEPRENNLAHGNSPCRQAAAKAKEAGKPVSFIEDCAVPLEHLADYTARLTAIFEKHGTRGTWYAHASVGTLHVRPILDMRRDGAPKMRAIAEEAAALVRKYRGAYSGEHGDGLCRGEWIRWQFGAKIDDAFRAIKQRLDPGNQFNPGKIIDPPKMDEARLMRFPPGYKTIPLTPVLDWSAWNVQNDPVTEQTTAPGTGGDNTGGLAKAVEMCNNNGHCRKFDAGTMCPSYRVTRDEQHLTRGRANTLRLALSGQLGDETLDGEAVKAALDLCVSCKGCKRDCPTGVDMARMKVEATAACKQRHGHTLRDKLIAHLPRYARFASALPWLFNLRDRVPLLARLSGRDATRRLVDGRTEALGWAPSDLLVLELEGGQRAMLRPSGTEPKLKLYFDGRAEPREGEPIAEARARAQQVAKAIRDDLVERLGGAPARPLS